MRKSILGTGEGGICERVASVGSANGVCHCDGDRFVLGSERSADATKQEIALVAYVVQRVAWVVIPVIVPLWVMAAMLFARTEAAKTCASGGHHFSVYHDHDFAGHFLQSICDPHVVPASMVPIECLSSMIYSFPEIVVGVLLNCVPRLCDRG